MVLVRIKGLIWCLVSIQQRFKSDDGNSNKNSSTICYLWASVSSCELDLSTCLFHPYRVLIKSRGERGHGSALKTRNDSG